MNKIIIYSSRLCPYCFAAKRLLKSLGLEYKEILIDRKPELKQEMIKKSKRFTVPQIFINGQHVGGYDDLSDKNRNGKLKKLLN